MLTPLIPKVEVEGQHIFPDDELHQYALRWKELNAAKRHTEAMLLLEKIIEGSTPMFERLAQHEKFHYTVDLEILLSAAQEKVVKWLLAWEPKLGKLFTWFSLHADTPILLENGTTRPIVELVRERYSGKVQCWNASKTCFEAKTVIDWSEQPSRRKEWSKLLIRRASGYSQPVYLTHEHRVWTQKGWRQAAHLGVNDELYLDTPVLTAEGQAALIGLYLGDGSVHKDHFRVGHGVKQRFYNEWLAAKFRGKMMENQTICWNTFTQTMMDHTGETTAYFNAADLWQDYKKLRHPKQITPWILERITPLSLAVWHMNDGNLTRIPGASIVTLATMGFTRQECAVLQEALGRFGIEATVQKSNCLCIKAASVDRFMTLVAPYVLREFDYKLLEFYRLVPKLNTPFVVDRIERIRHVSISERGSTSWEIRHKFNLYKKTCPGHYGTKTESFDWKYDLTVEDNHNFFAGKQRILVSNSKCAKHAFLSEILKVNQYRKRYYATDDSLEKFIGVEDHAIDKHDLAAEVRQKLDGLTCRWGDPQELGALRFLIECIIDEDNRDRQAAIRGAAYAFGISMDMSKFFYRWALTALRSAFMDKIRVNFSEQDLFLLSESYTDFADLHDIIPWEYLRRLMVVKGGQRIKIPTISYVIAQKENYVMWREIEATAKDPVSIAEVAERHKKTAKTAAQTYVEMCEKLNPRRAGEYYIYRSNDDDPTA